MAHRRRQRKIGPASTHDRSATPEPAPLVSLREKLVWAGLLLLAYACIGTWGRLDFSDFMGYYNMLAGAFLKGRLSIAATPRQTRLTDMVPFEGRYYL